MAQVTGTETQSASGSTAANLFASLKASFSMDSVKGGLFANLLSQSKNIQDQPVAAPEPAASAPPSDAQSYAAAANAAPAPASDNSADTSNEDEARVRSLLRQVRDDINQAKSARKDDSKKPAADKKDETAAKTDQKKAEPVATKDAATDVKTVKTDDAKTKLTADAAVTTDKTAAAATDVTAAVDGTVAASANAGDDKAGKDILAELIQTEQALVAMLHKMQQDKTAGAKSAATGDADKPTLTAGTIEAVKNGSGKSAVKGKTDAALAAAFGAGASSAEAPKATVAVDVKTEAKAVPPSVFTLGVDEAKAANNTEAAKNGEIDLKAMLQQADGDTPPVVLPTAAALAAAVTSAKTATAATTGEDSAPALRLVGGTATAGATATVNPLQAEGTKSTGSYDFASQLSAQRATKGGTAGLPPAVEQVALQLHKMVKEGTDQMTLQLRPADLGRIDIKLEFAKDGSKTVTGTVIADSQATLDMLQKDSGGLQRALQDAGLRADPNSLQFSLRGDGQQNGFAQNTNGQQQQGNQSKGYTKIAFEDDDSSTAGADETYYLAPGRVNLSV